MKYNRRLVFLFSTLYFILTPTLAQHSNFSRIELITDTASFNSVENTIKTDEGRRLYFVYSDNKQTVEIRLYPTDKNQHFRLVPSRDFEVIDTLLNLGNYSRFKIRFNDLINSHLLRLTFSLTEDTLQKFEEIPLQPVTNTFIKIHPADNQLYIGEEKSYEVISNNPENLNISSEWVSNDNFDFRFTNENGKIYLHIVPKKLGEQKFSTNLQTHKPWLNARYQLVYTTPLVEFEFNVKSSRLQFLTLDKPEITLDENTRVEGLEIQLENSQLLEMQKTYRLEEKESPGGALIAEIYTRQRLANNKVLCLLRPYNYHKSADGYLYIKNGDDSRFITNFSITPATKIEKISILHEGQQWQDSRNIYPGESFDIKLEGTGLHKARFHFEDLIDITRDTLVKSENLQMFRLKVPIDISKKQINILNNSAPTGQSLNIVEYQLPREFDYIFIDYGDMGRRVSSLKEPLFYKDVIKDLTISFNTDKIDEDKLYGKQYINIQVRITGKKNELVDLKTIENIAVCPSGESPRLKYYAKKDCSQGDISLNQYIKRPTYDLDDWSRIELTITNDRTKYGGAGNQKEIELILKKDYSFDIEVSFPAGLLTITPSDTTETFGTLSGISMAMIAQFSFYHPKKINVYRPFKVGAGFLALNAFNFNENSGRDVGIVLLGSLYPTSRDTKLSFPLYMGGGYFLKAKKFFFLVGPGIRVRL